MSLKIFFYIEIKKGFTIKICMFGFKETKKNKIKLNFKQNNYEKILFL